MTRYLSSIRTGLTALLLVVVASALYAQTSTNSAVTNSTLSPITPKAISVLFQNSNESPITFPAPETILGHRLFFGLGPRNAATQRAAGTASSLAHERRTITHRYFVTDIGTLGGTQSFAYGINDPGQVVGFAWIAGDASGHSFLYSNGRMTDLYPLNSQEIVTVGPTGINNSGQIASGTIAGGVYSPAAFNSRTGDLTLLGSLGGITPYGFNGVATSINSVGDAVGYSYMDSINRHAFLYSTGVMTDIDFFGGYSAALAINDEGVIVGFESHQNSPETAFFYSHGVTTDIFAAGTESTARGVNNRGQVVGEFLTADQSAFHAFLYSGGVITDLGSPESPETIAFAINDQRQVVGTTYVPYEASCVGVPCVQYKAHAFFFQSGNMADLNALIPSDSGWELSWGFDINNHGRIVGYGLVNDKYRAFLLTPATNKEQCKKGGWKDFGFTNQGRCIQFVNTGK